MTDHSDIEAMLLEDSKPQPVSGDKLQELVELTNRLGKCRELKKRMEMAEKINNEEITKLENEILPAKMTELGVPSIGLPNGKTVEIENIIAAKMPPKDDPDYSGRISKCLSWLDGHGLGDIAKRTVVADVGKNSEALTAKIIEEIKRMTNDQVPVEARYDVHYQTLNATLKLEMRAGRPLPKGDDGFEIYIGPRAKVK